MKNQNHHAITGISLIELLLSITLGAFLISALIELGLLAKKAYAINQALAQIQEDARFTTVRMSEDIRQAGYIGCPRLSEIIPHNATALNFSSVTRLIGFHNGISTANYPMPTLAKHPKLDSDMLIVQEEDPQAVLVVLAHNQEIELGQMANFKIGDSVVVSDCSHADVVKVSNMQGDTLFLSTNLAHEYTLGAQVGKLFSWLYYVAATGRKNQSGNPIYALYRRDLRGPTTQPSEWVDNVENMQIQLGIQQDPGDPIHFYSGDAMLHWQNLVLVHIELLMASEENVFTKPHTYIFQHKQHAPTDKRLYRSWNFQVALREPVKTTN